jgi:hypothetical protein
MLHGTKPIQSAGRIMSAVAAAANPLGGQDFWAAIMPTILDPGLEVLRNRTFFGSKIKPNLPNDKRPESEQHFTNVNPAAEALTRWLNNATGGNDFREGFISVSPEHVEHLVTAYTGGLGRLTMNTQKFITDLATGQPIDAEKTPFVRQIYGNITAEMPTYRAYRAIAEEAEAVWHEFKGLSKAGDKDGAGEARTRDPVLFGLVAQIRATEKQLDKLRDRERKIMASRLSDEEKESRIAPLRERQQSIMREALEKWDAAHRKAKP